MGNTTIKTTAYTCDGCNCITQIKVNNDWLDIVPTVECPLCAGIFCIGNSECCSDVSNNYPDIITDTCLDCYEMNKKEC